MKKISILAFGLFLIVIVLCIANLSLAKDVYYDLIEGQRFGEIVFETEQQLGFDDHIVDTIDKQNSQAKIGKYYIFTSIEQGGIFDTAGFKQADVIEVSQYELFKRILFSQNSEITIPITRNGDYLEIKVFIPTLNLSVDPNSLKRY